MYTAWSASGRSACCMKQHVHVISYAQHGSSCFTDFIISTCNSVPRQTTVLLSNQNLSSFAECQVFRTSMLHHVLSTCLLSKPCWRWILSLSCRISCTRLLLPCFYTVQHIRERCSIQNFVEQVANRQVQSNGNTWLASCEVYTVALPVVCCPSTDCAILDDTTLILVASLHITDCCVI